MWKEKKTPKLLANRLFFFWGWGRRLRNVSQYTQALEDYSVSVQIELSNPITKKPVEQSMHN